MVTPLRWVVKARIPIDTVFKLKYHGNNLFYTFPNSCLGRFLTSIIPAKKVVHTVKPVQSPKLTKWRREMGKFPAYFDPNDRPATAAAIVTNLTT